MSDSIDTGLIATLQEWKTFLSSNVYKDMMTEIAGRNEILTNKLIAGGDETFSDENLRGRINELDFIKSMAADVTTLMEMDDNRKHTEETLDKLNGNQ